MAHGIKVKILADSINPTGTRLSSFQINGFPKCLVAELNTHRVFSRNSASSRAVPVLTMCERVESNPYIPESFGSNKKGMQPGESLGDYENRRAGLIWSGAMENALVSAKQMAELNTHKQWANRLIEPFMRTDIVLSGTRFEQFVKQRYSDRVPNTSSAEFPSGTPMAQVEIWETARQVLRLLINSKPNLIEFGGWHLPYIDRDDIDKVEQDFEEGLFYPDFNDVEMVLAAVSAARCARVSYFTREGDVDIHKDVKLFLKLRSDGHWSPLEMPAVVIRSDLEHETSSNYGAHSGWKQLRKFYQNEFITEMPKLLEEDDHE